MRKFLSVVIVLFSALTAQGVFAGYAEELAAEEELAMNALRPLAEKGDAESQLKFGMMYYSAVSRDPNNCKMAEKWYRKAAEQGNAPAMNQLGDLYTRGRCKEDKAQATQWYQKAVKQFTKLAKQGNSDAQVDLAVLYNNGEAISRDYVKSNYWYLKAAEQGDARAQYSLGTHYEYGRGFAKDDVQAANWYRKSAEQGDAVGQMFLDKLQDRVGNINSIEKVSVFRKSLKEGDETNCGPVLEVKSQLIKIYFPVANYSNEHWVRRENIFPGGYGCRFVNGQYQSPQ